MHPGQPDAPSLNAASLEWRDGDMPYSMQFGDHFYCREDGRLECGHVFLAGNHLPERWLDRPTFTIAELGFGTGLNLCETARQWRELRSPGAALHYYSFERYPMTAVEIDRALSRWPEIAAERAALVAAWPQEPGGTIDISLADGLRLTVLCGDANERIAEPPTPVDAWFLDGFAPSRNPDLWSEALMQRVFAATAQGGRFATYAAAGFVRRNLQAAGFIVERRPGFAGKREMLCGERPDAAA